VRQQAKLAVLNLYGVACLFAVVKGIIPEKNAYPKESLPTAVLPKAALLFSLFLPAVKLLLKIPLCIALPPILQSRLLSS